MCIWQERRLLVRELTGTVRNIQFHDREHFIGVKLKGMSDGDTFLAIYVLLSRATKPDDLLLLGTRARQLFEKGLLALPLLQQRMKALEDRAAQDRDAAKGICKATALAQVPALRRCLRSGRQPRAWEQNGSAPWTDHTWSGNVQ